MNHSLSDRLLFAVVPPLAHTLVSFLGWTGRYQIPEGDEVFPKTRSQGPSIVVFWHSRILLHLYFYRNLNVFAFVSHHRDGELMAKTLSRFGFSTVRGSTSRGALGGLKGLLRVLKEGHDVAVAPDGPRGPACVVSPGVIALARLSGCPIRPVAYSARNNLRARSWDRFMVPLPFSHGAVVWGDPIHVPRRTDETLEMEKRKDLERALNQVTEQADSLVHEANP